jgi:hypothetical protein
MGIKMAAGHDLILQELGFCLVQRELNHLQDDHKTIHG